MIVLCIVPFAHAARLARMAVIAPTPFRHQANTVEKGSTYTP